MCCFSDLVPIKKYSQVNNFGIGGSKKICDVFLYPTIEYLICHTKPCAKKYLFRAIWGSSAIELGIRGGGYRSNCPVSDIVAK